MVPPHRAALSVRDEVYLIRVNWSPLSSGGLPAAMNWNWSAPPDLTWAAIVPWSLLSRRIASPAAANVPVKVTAA